MKKDIKKTSEPATKKGADFDSRLDKSEITQRLQEAVFAGGGNKKVAARTGIPLSTINNYTTGESEPKLSAAALISAACNISLSWLAFGEGSRNNPEAMHRDESSAEPQNHIALAVYESIYKSGSLVSTETFNSLLISLYNFHMETEGQENLSPDDKKSQKLKELLATALRGAHK
jgi:transcriptional regulator with XRE-family HTH domain